jgi:hypothetical protein
MQLTPGEKTVLAQVRVLYQAAGREQPLKALIAQWPPTHYETYRTAYAALVAKQLLEETGAQIFRLTNAGLRAIGAAPVKPQPQAPRASQPGAVVQRAPQPAAPKPRRSMLSRLARGVLGRT